MEVSLGDGCAGGRRLAQPARREAGDICLTRRARRVPCRIQSLPDELLGGVDYCLRCGPIFQSKAAFFRSNSGRNGKAGRL